MARMKVSLLGLPHKDPVYKKTKQGQGRHSRPKKEKNFYADKVADNWINCEKSMLSTQYRLRLEFICKRIADGEEVKLDDMIWAEKLGKANRSAAEMLRKKARRIASNPDMVPGSLDDFMNQMDIGDPDPSNHIVDGFNTVEEIAAWFKQRQD